MKWIKLYTQEYKRQADRNIMQQGDRETKGEQGEEEGSLKSSNDLLIDEGPKRWP